MLRLCKESTGRDEMGSYESRWVDMSRLEITSAFLIFCEILQSAFGESASQPCGASFSHCTTGVPNFLLFEPNFLLF